MSRKIKMSPVKNILRVPVLKVPNKRHVLVESFLERDCCIALEFDPQVIVYEPQPRTFLYLDHVGAQRRYTPDFWVRRTNAPDPETYVEVKPVSKLNDSAVLQTLETVRAHIEKCGYGYSLFTELTRGDEVFAENRRHFYPYLLAAHFTSNDEFDQVLKLGFPSTIARVAERENSRHITDLARQLIATGSLTFDWSKLFSYDETKVDRNA